MDRVNLSVLGLSTSQSHAGAYALILQAEESKTRIPIIIGPTEAQAIAIALENLKPPRPLTHDLFLDLSKAYDIELLEVEINKIEEGIFYSKLSFKGPNKNIKMDARTSDAIALAIRFKASIFATKEVLEKAGIIIEDGEDQFAEESKKTQKTSKKPTKKSIINNLKKLLQKAIEKEDYEEASKLKSELSKLEDSDK